MEHTAISSANTTQEHNDDDGKVFNEVFDAAWADYAHAAGGSLDEGIKEEALNRLLEKDPIGGWHRVRNIMHEAMTAGPDEGALMFEYRHSGRDRDTLTHGITDMFVHYAIEWAALADEDFAARAEAAGLLHR